MADDIRVEQSDLLRQYSTQLQRFASSITRGSKNIVGVLEKIDDYVSRESQQHEKILAKAECDVHYIVQKYEDARSRYRLDGMNSALLGTTDLELKQKLLQLQSLIEFQQSKLKIIKNKSQSFTERTQAFSSNVNETSQRGGESLNRYASIIDEYKGVK